METVYSYSASVGGFFVNVVHGDAIPEDAISIPITVYQELQEGLATGKHVMPPDAEHDLPYLADPPAPTVDELAKAARAERDRLIAETDYLMMPDYPINDEARAAVEAYRQALRDVTGQAGFPTDIVWPDKVTF